MPKNASTSFFVFSGLAFVSGLFLGFLEFFGALYWFGVPILLFVVFLVGAVISRAAALTKASVIVACILSVPVTSIIFQQIRSAEPETFLIPQGFQGWFVVFYDEACGSPPRYENGRRIYDIPSDGVLISSFKKNDGYLDSRFYTVDESGTRTEIPYFDWQNFETEKKYWTDRHSRFGTAITKDTVGVFWGYGAETYFVSQNSLNYLVAPYAYYDQPERERWTDAHNFTNRAKDLLTKCRESQSSR